MGNTMIRRGRTSTGSPCHAVEIAQAQPGELVEVGGYVHCVTLRPSKEMASFEAEVTDDTGTLRLVWLGRRRMVGIEPGRKITARGRVTDAKGGRAIFNPEYELTIPSSA